jgi:hypothetical protein
MDVRMTLLSALFLTVTVYCSDSYAQQTIPEAARAHQGGRIERGRVTDVERATVEDLAGGADLVLEGTVTKLKSYLTSDEQDILTDYQVLPTRALLGNVTAKRATPGTSSPIVLTVYGGELVVGGVKVLVLDHSIKPPKSGSRYLLFLKRFGPDGHFALYNAGAFEIDDEALHSVLTRDAQLFDDVAGTPLSRAIQRIEIVAARRRQ